MGCEFYRLGMDTLLTKLPVLDTCTETTAELCKIPGGRGGKFKLPTLTELHQFLFDQAFEEAHNATADVEATTRCFLELLRRSVFTAAELKDSPDYLVQFREANPEAFELVGIEHQNLKEASARLREAALKQAEKDSTMEVSSDEREALMQAPFVHLHNHSQFSILQSTASTADLVTAASSDGMPAVALTDSGNMMGAFHFVQAVQCLIP